MAGCCWTGGWHLFACMCIFVCRSCHAGLLLQCDYCPLLFHLDCLNPPLTALPSGRWMCPNHVEQAVVSRVTDNLHVIIVHCAACEQQICQTPITVFLSTSGLPHFFMIQTKLGECSLAYAGTVAWDSLDIFNRTLALLKHSFKTSLFGWVFSIIWPFFVRHFFIASFRWEVVK